MPVLVWIHGGGFHVEAGTYEHYGPKYLMDSGIVVVTLNYRLGPFGNHLKNFSIPDFSDLYLFLGFLTTVDDVIPPNLGLKDQRFALEWIQENIELFGGDKSSVTIAGESAGSAAVGLHLMAPWENDKGRLTHVLY